MFGRVKIRNFSTTDEKYQLILLNWSQKIIAKETIGACFNEIYLLTEKMSKFNDPGLRFLASELKLLISESELIRFSLVEPYKEGILKRNTIKDKERVFSEIHRLYAFPDLPRLHDILIKFYTRLYEPVLPRVNVPTKKLAHELVIASKALKSRPPSLCDFYKIIRKFGHRIINEDPDLTFSFNYIGQLFFEVLYLKRPYLTREQYLEICRTFGDFLDRFAKAIKKRNRVDLYNNLYDLYNSVVR